MLYTKHIGLTDNTETTIFTVPTGFHIIIHYIFVANHGGSTKNASLHFADSDGSNRLDIFDDESLSSGGRLTLGNGGGPMFVLHEGEVAKAQTEVSADMEFAVTFDLIEMPASLVNFA
jgi:hypothetical protein|tara:strand:+ start:282 stop:635 length:354 start_codon:yes stop_codon:yes gene_type:complete